MKVFKRSVYWNEHKTKKENKDARNKCRQFLVSNFVGVSRLFVLVCSNFSNDGKRFSVRRYYLPKGIITSSSIEKTSMANPLILLSNHMKKKESSQQDKVKIIQQDIYCVMNTSKIIIE